MYLSIEKYVKVRVALHKRRRVGKLYFKFNFLPNTSNMQIVSSNTTFDYGNCKFILGSVAEVERLWSMVDAYLDGKRNKTTQLLMEALVFLRLNRQFWDDKTILEAYKIVKNENASTRFNGMIEEDDLYGVTHPEILENEDRDENDCEDL